MKDINQIEGLSIEQLVENSSSLKAPKNLQDRLGGAIRKRSLLKGALWTVTAAAACICTAVAIEVSLSSQRPKDTFDDPLLAYAALEQAFGKVSAAARLSTEMAGEAEAKYSEALVKAQTGAALATEALLSPSQILNNISK